MKNIYSRHEFLYARPLAHAIITDVRFRHWFLSETKFADRAVDARILAEEQASLRTTENSKKWFWFNVYCPRDRQCKCRGEKGIETDILIIFEIPLFEGFDRFRFALHIEVKPPDKGFLPGQAESYDRRGRCWADPARRPNNVPEYHDFVTILVCGDNLRSDTRISEFTDVIYHNEIDKYISPYPDVSDQRDG